MAYEKFHFTFEDGKKITVPKFNQVMTIGVARKARHQGESEVGWMVIEKAADEKALAIIDEQTMDQFSDFMTAWQKDSGITPGES